MPKWRYSKVHDIPTILHRWDKLYGHKHCMTAMKRLRRSPGEMFRSHDLGEVYFRKRPILVSLANENAPFADSSSRVISEQSVGYPVANFKQSHQSHRQSNASSIPKHSLDWCACDYGYTSVACDQCEGRACHSMFALYGLSQ